jgi:Mn-dependent DtxR family transcriptional regulator
MPEKPDPRVAALLTPIGMRLITIERLLTHGATFADLRKALKVSPATVKRDLQCLREDFGARVTYTAADRRYRLGQHRGCRAFLLAFLDTETDTDIR